MQGTEAEKLLRAGGEISMDSGEITFPTEDQILIANGSNVRVRGNRFVNRWLRIDNCTDVLIDENTFDDVDDGDGIRLRGCMRTLVRGNTLRNISHSGIVLGASDAGTRNSFIQIVGNSIVNSGLSLVAGRAAIQSRGNPGALKNDNHVLVADNTITNPGIVGIGLDASEDTVVQGNNVQVYNSGEGIAIVGKNVDVIGNYVSKTVLGGGCCLVFGDDAAGGYPTENIRILNNYFEQLAAGGQVIAIVPAQDDQVLDNIRIHGNVLRGANWSCHGYTNEPLTGDLGVDNFFFTGNYAEPISGDFNMAAWPVRNVTASPNP